MDPIHQFKIVSLYSFGGVAPYNISLTQSAVYMIVATLALFLVFHVALRRHYKVPNRYQAAVELVYRFILDTLMSSTGTSGKRFLPIVFALFLYVSILNLIGMIPFAFAVNSHIIVTFTLAMVVIVTVFVSGIVLNGGRFFKIFYPPGVPFWLAPMIIFIEIVSFLSRPVTLAVRLFANVLAGHIALQIFASFIPALLATKKLWIIFSPFPFALCVALTALELLVSLLQAYVFATLTTIYLNDALHPEH